MADATSVVQLFSDGSASSALYDSASDGGTLQGVGVDADGAVYAGVTKIACSPAPNCFPRPGPLVRVSKTGERRILGTVMVPTGIVPDGGGGAYVAEQYAVAHVDSQGQKTVLAGQLLTEVSTSGYADGAGAAAKLSGPGAMARDGQGNFYFVDTPGRAPLAAPASQTIRKVAPDGTVTTIAGIAFQKGSQDGPVASATFSNPRGIALDGQGNIYVADTGNNLIRKITSAGMVSTVAGHATPSSWEQDGAGSGAGFCKPDGIAVGPDGNLYIADSWGNTVRKMTPAGVVTTFAGKANPNFCGLD